MREAIANAGVFNFVIIFVTLLLAFFIGSLGYSKAFKVKNLIIAEIEKEEGYTSDVKSVVEDSLGEIGYRMVPSTFNTCPTETVNGASYRSVSNSHYQYCVYEINNCLIKNGTTPSDLSSRKCSIHYRVIAYMYFDIPIINELIRVPVRGETKSFSVLRS